MVKTPKFSYVCEPITWHGAPGVILTEDSHYYVNGEMLSAVVPLIDGIRSVDEIVAELDGRFSQEAIYYHLIQLEKKGFIEENRPKDRPTEAREAFWSMFGRIGTEKSHETRNKQPVLLTALGIEDLGPMQEALADTGLFEVIDPDRLGDPGREDCIWVVVTPDYLEPELEELNREALRLKRAWLLVKPSGIVPFIGPLFVPEQTGCWQCLASRLRLRHEIELMQMSRVNNGQTLRLSRGRTDLSVGIVYRLLALEMSALRVGRTDHSLEGAVLSIDFRTMETRRHHLTRRPHCSACGTPRTPYIVHWQSPAPLGLQSQPKAPLSDGGDRVRSAEETLKALENLISPVTGLIPKVNRSPADPAFLGYHFGTVISSKEAMLPLSLGRIYPTGASGGKGFTEAQAKVSAIGEAVERYCARYHGDEPVVRARHADLGRAVVHPRELLNYSERQYAERESWNKGSPLAYVPDPCEDDTEIAWTQAWSITHNQWKLVPCSYVYFGFPLEAGACYARANSNGVAAGNCREEAIVQGLLELIERDAVALWWQNRLRRPLLDLASFQDDAVDRAISGFEQRDRHLYAFDLTSDLGIPAFCAVALHLSDPNQPPRFGLGCHFDPRVALRRSLGELGQVWASPKMDDYTEAMLELRGMPWSEKEFIRPLPGATRAVDDFPDRSFDDFLQDIEFLVSVLSKQSLEVLVVDLTHRDVGLDVVRVIAPGLRHMWPRFGPGRLYEVPVAMGWLDRPRMEDELLAVPFDY